MNVTFIFYHKYICMIKWTLDFFLFVWRRAPLPLMQRKTIQREQRHSTTSRHSFKVLDASALICIVIKSFFSVLTYVKASQNSKSYKSKENTLKKILYQRTSWVTSIHYFWLFVKFDLEIFLRFFHTFSFNTSPNLVNPVHTTGLFLYLRMIFWCFQELQNENSSMKDRVNTNQYRPTYFRRALKYARWSSWF